MKYGDWISFDAIETVVQLLNAKQKDTASSLIKRYVISSQMAEKLKGVVFPHLQFDKPGPTNRQGSESSKNQNEGIGENKGIFIIGNYGTGKSHLMSVISALAEHGDMRESLLRKIDDKQDEFTIPSKVVHDASVSISGKFKVIRTEIGATEMSLRQILVSELEAGLEEIGISFSFPPANEIVNNKSSFEDMMAAFNEVYPDTGLLLVVDELLDFLRTRKQQELILDLNFLREIGEICNNLRFRFMAGIQEAIFDNPKFQFVSDTLKRASTRFEEIHIARDDVKFVVSERLLRKSSTQLAQVRAYLEKFGNLYGNFSERIDEFAKLFPVHPDYIEVFERVAAVEKREILKSLSYSIRQILDQDVPEDQPGVIAYDRYWQVVCESPSLRANPEIRPVIDCSRILEARIEASFTKPTYKNLAKRIIHALSVHRLTHNDIYAQLGATAQELRDTLCLFQPGILELGGADPAADLLTCINTTIKEIHKTLSGQFISNNAENGQHFIDLKKIQDFDAKIEQKAETLDGDILNSYFYNALASVMEKDIKSSYVSGYKIWEHELIWQTHKAGRRGYLFFGAPDERSTAVPTRDFYLYFIQPFEPRAYKDQKHPDEVFFKLTTVEENLKLTIKKYAASIELSLTNQGQDRLIYENKANGTNGFLQQIVKWLREHILDSFEVVYQGKSKSMKDWITGGGMFGLSPNLSTVRDSVNTVSSTCLETQFHNDAPEYPFFPVVLTFGPEGNVNQAVADALRAIADPGKRTTQAKHLLNALELLEGDRIYTGKSRFTKYISDMLRSKPAGQVVNRAELIASDSDVEFLGVGKSKIRLEPELAVVVLAALVNTGEIVLALSGRKFDATQLGELAATSIEELKNFKHLEAPKDWNLPGIVAMLKFLDLPEGLSNSLIAGQEQVITQIQTDVSQKIRDLLKASELIKSGAISIWGTPLLSEQTLRDHQANLTVSKELLEKIQPFNTTGKFKNFKFSELEFESGKKGMNSLSETNSYLTCIQELNPVVNYLIIASSVLDGNDEIRMRIEKARLEVVSKLSTSSSSKCREEIETTLKRIKADYSAFYLAAHKKARLSVSDDKKKEALINDSRLQLLSKLETISILPASQLKKVRSLLGDLKTCTEFTKSNLELAPECPYCRFKPSSESSSNSTSQILADIDQLLDSVLEGWRKLLIENLEDPTITENISLLTTAQQEVVRSFLSTRQIPANLDSAFIFSVNEILSGLERVAVSSEKIRTVIFRSGAPSTIDELKKNFEEFLDDLVKEKDRKRVRVVLE